MFSLIIILLKIGGVDMAVIYTTLIVKGLKTYNDVPAILKPAVKEQLIALELGELVTE